MTTTKLALQQSRDLRNNAKFFAVGSVLAALSGCSSVVPAPMPSPLKLSDAMIQTHKGDIQGLYKAWFAPLENKQRGGIKFNTQAELSAAEVAVKDGFERFCVASGGTVSKQPMPPQIQNWSDKYGVSYRCTTASGLLITEFSIQRFEGNTLASRYETPATQAANNVAEDTYKARQAANGPSGWLTTDMGRFRFLRIGSLQKRDVLEVQADRLGIVPIEQISRIDFRGVNTEIQTKDGRNEIVNIIGLRNRYTFTSTQNYGLNGFPFVLIDPKSKLTYEVRFANFIGIKTIEIDSEDTWRSTPGATISGIPFTKETPSFSIAISNERLREYRIAYERATNPAAISDFIRSYAQHDPDKLVPKLEERLRGIKDKEREKALQVRMIGTDICNNHQGTSSKIIGNMSGEPVYGPSRNGMILIIGNTEGVNADRIQIRVNRIRFIDEATYSSSDLGFSDYNGKRIIPGTVFWDLASSWSVCSV